MVYHMAVDTIFICACKFVDTLQKQLNRTTIETGQNMYTYTILAVVTAMD